MTKELDRDAAGMPLIDSSVSRCVSSADFARLIGISKSAVTFMTREADAPYNTRGWRWPEACHWYIGREVSKGRAR